MTPTSKAMDPPRKQQRKVINPCWTKVTEGVLHSSIRSLVTTLGLRAAKYPFTTIGITCFVSLALLVIGFFTNFHLELDQLVFLTPTGSLPELHSQWINSPTESGFPKVRPFFFVYHENGENVVTANAMRVTLEGMQVLFQTKDFAEICNQSQFIGSNGEPTCWTSSVTNFWNHQLSVFEQELQQVPSNMTPDEWIQTTVSASAYPDNTPVFHEAILGNYHGYNTTTNEPVDYTDAPPPSLNWAMAQALHQTDNQLHIESAQSLVIKVDIPDIGQRTDDLEARILDRFADFQQEQNNNDSNNDILVEYFTMNGYQTEMMRALYIDMPLVGVLVVVMLAFTVFVFYDRHEPVQSRGLLGIFSMSTIGLSLATGYGFMWCIGVPMTTVGIMIPFVVVGVGLDDTFIITGTYFRLMREQQQQQQNQPLHTKETSNTQQQEEKNQQTLNVIQQTLQEVGVSITMTTTTTLIAFLMGSVSSIPAVRWLCWYAAACIFVDFIYQITCFVAFMVLDEQRVQAGRKDLCFWIVVEDDTTEEDCAVMVEDGDEEDSSNLEKGTTQDSEDEELVEADDSINHEVQDEKTATSEANVQQSVGTSVDVSTSQQQQKQPTKQENDSQKPLTQRFMSWYADQLLKPIGKAIVLLVFVAYFAGTAYSTTLLYQEFNINDYIPEDSFMASFMFAYREYSTVFRYIGVYFRNVDQSDPVIQQQMHDYVQELSQLPQIGEPPAFFWLRDFEELTNSEHTEQLPLDISGLSFNQQVDLALSIPQLNQIYGQDIVRDPESGNITASRTFLYLRELDIYDPVADQVKMLNDQRDITLTQEVNQPDQRVNNELSFFTFDDVYFFWELYDVIVDELIFTTISCVIVVSAIAFVMIPHWTALAFVCPLLIMLYFNLLGTMQFCGIKVNSITYFIIVMAIGLLVDFLMHVLLRYYETTGRTRHEKVKQTLETMGVPIMLGGFTTFLGVIPLAFSTTKIFMTVFISFLAMVTLGCLAGLVLLPVLLSIVGPVVTISSVSDDDMGCERDEDESLSDGRVKGELGEDTHQKSMSLNINGVVLDITDEVEA